MNEFSWLLSGPYPRVCYHIPYIRQKISEKCQYRSYCQYSHHERIIPRHDTHEKELSHTRNAKYILKNYAASDQAGHGVLGDGAELSEGARSGAMMSGVVQEKVALNSA